MLFNSFSFIFFFLPITLLSFFTAAKYSKHSALGILFLASIIFYGWCDYHYALLLLFSIFVNFNISKQIIGSEALIPRKRFLWLGICFNLGLLAYFKYTDFFIQNINLALHAHLPLFNIVLPIGISFFTFTQIAFLVDSYKGLIKKYSLLNYALFVTYFPHLIAGPIIHHQEVMPQFEQKRMFSFDPKNFLLGFTLFAFGLFKKTVIADSLAPIVSPVFDMVAAHGQYISTPDAWVSALAYTLELYFDFSAYSDMALGISLLFGVRLPVNFFSPYKSVNIIEFWRRWNMTLSRFLRDYLYIPLGGNRNGPAKRYINLMATMLLGGLWHGANWTFVIWGCLHGIYLCINHGWISLKKRLGFNYQSSFIGRAFSCLLTFLAVIIAWVFFRADNFTTATAVLHAMFFQSLTVPATWHLPQALLTKIHIEQSSTQPLVASHDSILIIFTSLGIVWLLPNCYQLLKRFNPCILPKLDNVAFKNRFFAWKPSFLWNQAVAIVFVFAIIHVQVSSVFLYFQF